MTRPGTAFATGMVVLGLLLAIALPGGVARARAVDQPHGLEARDSAVVHKRGYMSVGILEPLRWAVADGIELQTHPLLLIGSPNIRVRVLHLKRNTRLGPIRLTAEYGLLFPSPAFRLPVPLGLQGYVAPTCAVQAEDPERGTDCQRPGWVLVPNAGLLFSWGERHVLTARLDVDVGILLAGERGRPLDTWTPIELLFAPVFRTFTVRLGVRYDRQLFPWWRIAAQVNLRMVGRGPDPKRNPFVFSAWFGMDFALGRYTRLTAGVIYYNADQRRVVVQTGDDGYGRFVPVRSHDVYPTFDLIWAWSL